MRFAIAASLLLAACATFVPPLPPPPPPAPVPELPRQLCIVQGRSQTCCLACARMRELDCDAFGVACTVRCKADGWGEAVAKAVLFSEIEDAISKSKAARADQPVTWFGLFACTNWRGR
jgi:hypothetical protein